MVIAWDGPAVLYWITRTSWDCEHAVVGHQLLVWLPDCLTTIYYYFPFY